MDGFRVRIITSVTSKLEMAQCRAQRHTAPDTVARVAFAFRCICRMRESDLKLALPVVL